jgi:integrase
VLRGFFGWCVKREMAPVNPALPIEKASVTLPPPHIHTPEQVSAVLHSCLTVCPSMLAWYALGYWCGIRIEEMASVKWSDIHIDKRTVFVSPEVAKKRRQRYVTLPDCAAEWLELAGTNIGTVYFSRTYHTRIVAAAKVRWSRNVMRHSFGSYHLALTGNASETAMLMGHTDTKVIYDHYRNPVVRDQAHGYFAVRPPVALRTGQDRSISQPSG